MSGGQHPGTEVGNYTDRWWLYQHAFGPGTEDLRRAVADALDRRIGEVVDTVLEAITKDQPDLRSQRMLESQAEYTRQGTALVVRWIRTEEVASQAEFEGMGQVRRMAASVTGQVTRMVLANLAFRDSVKKILGQEVSRLGGTLETLLALWSGVDVGFSQNLMQIGRLFDRRSQAYEEALADKEAQLQHQALHDSLTELANRALLFDRLDHACERLRRHPERGGVGLVFVDLDDFKLINDRHGHVAGDAVLREVAQRLAATVRPEDTVARLGGDEFVVMCEAVPDAGWADGVAKRIGHELSAPMELEGTLLVPAASIGTAVGFPPHCDVERLVRDADDAMYHAKRAAKEARAARAAARTSA